MKKHIFFIVSTLILLGYPVLLNAQSVWMFDITSPAPISEGKIAISNSNTSTPIEFEIIANTATDLPTQEPFACDMVITLVYEKNGIIEEISDEIAIANNLYEPPYMNTAVLEFKAVLPANRMGGVIKLRYKSIQWGSKSVLTQYSKFSFQTVPPPVVAPPGTVDWNNPANAKFIPVSQSSRNVFYAGTTVRRNGNFHLEFQTDGNLVLYNGTTPIWASRKTRGNNNTRVLFDSSGIGCYEGTTRYYFDSLSGWARPAAVWVLQDDGNFVCYTSYKIDSNGVIYELSYPVGATMTQGGQKSNRSGRIN